MPPSGIRSLCVLFLSTLRPGVVRWPVALMFPSIRADLRFRIVRQLCLLASGRRFGPTHTDKQDPCQVVLSRESTDTGLVWWSETDRINQIENPLESELDIDSIIAVLFSDIHRHKDLYIYPPINYSPILIQQAFFGHVCTHNMESIHHPFHYTLSSSGIFLYFLILY